ncbi:MAG: HigA family addiction module antidote protein [Halomonas sp.]|nr:HigA family addiction module antidote protein [Halomonas sp.]
MTRNGMRPIHPGEILREEYLEPLEMSVNALSMALHVPATRMNEIVRENRGITADTAMRLARYFGTSERFWLNLQTEFSLRQAQITKADQVAREIEPHVA